MNSWPDRRTWPGVGVRRVVERAGQQLPVGVRLVRLDLGEQLVDEVLMSLEYCHRPSVPLAFRRVHPRLSEPRSGGNHRCADERQRAHVRAPPTDEEAAPGRPHAAGARRSLRSPARARHAPQPRRDQPGLARVVPRRRARRSADRPCNASRSLVVPRELREIDGRSASASPRCSNACLGLAEPRLGAGEVVVAAPRGPRTRSSASRQQLACASSICPRRRAGRPSRSSPTRAAGTPRRAGRRRRRSSCRPRRATAARFVAGSRTKTTVPAGGRRSPRRRR